MASEREQRVRAAAIELAESALADGRAHRSSIGLATVDQLGKLVAIACEPEAAPDAEVYCTMNQLTALVSQVEEAVDGMSEATANRDIFWRNGVKLRASILGELLIVARDCIRLRRRAQPATANELAIRELEALRDNFRETAEVGENMVRRGFAWAALRVEQRLAALRQPAPAKEEAQ